MGHWIVAGFMILLAMGLGPAAWAHSKVSQTHPADGAVVQGAPAAVTMIFDKKIRLTKVQMSHGDHAPVALDLGAQKAFLHDFSLPLPDDGPGVYTIKWRGLGEDGHAMQGSFSFQVE